MKHYPRNHLKKLPKKRIFEIYDHLEALKKATGIPKLHKIYTNNQIPEDYINTWNHHVTNNTPHNSRTDLENFNLCHCPINGGVKHCVCP